MAWSKNKTLLVAGAAGLLALAGATMLFIHLRDPHRLALAEGNRAMARHLAEPRDLAAYYQTPASYFDKITRFPAWKAVPRGFQTFDHVPLQIDGMICLWGEGNAKMGLNFPESWTGIQLNQKFETLYVYHASFFSSPAGTPVYDIVFRYADGSSVTNQILYGDDVLDWYANRGRTVIGPTAARSKLAWHGVADLGGNKKQPLRFCLTAVKNPFPATVVTSVDLYSCKSRTAACILAFTPGRAGLMR
jgi:hypothetical protein